MQYDDNVLIDVDDLVVNNSKKKRKINNTNDITSNNTSASEHDNSNDNSSNETWIARLVRFLVVGLLDNRWETRHGCSVGLTAFINGLYPNMQLGDDVHTKHSHKSSYSLPWFIVEDIICSGIGVLIYDQFLDFGLGISAVSPVKEACGQLIASAARTCDSTIINIVYQKLFDICNSPIANLNVRCGGLIALKYFIPVHALVLFHESSNNSNSNSFDSLIILAKSFLIEQHDDLNNISCSLVKSIHYAIQSVEKFNLQFHLQWDNSSFLLDVLQGLYSAASRLNPLSGCLLNLADSTHVCAKIYSNMYAIDSGKDIHKCYVSLLEVISMILLKLYQYTDDMRLKTVTILIEALDIIIIPTCPTTITINEYARVLSVFLTSFLISFSCRPGGSLGDLFLVSKDDQDRKDYDGPHANYSNNDNNDYADTITKALITTETASRALTRTILCILHYLMVIHINY